MTASALRAGSSRCCEDFNPKTLVGGKCLDCGHDHAEDPLSSYPLD